MMIEAGARWQRLCLAPMLAVACCVVLVQCKLPAQTPAAANGAAQQTDNSTAPLPAFEVVSIKPNKSDSMMSRIMMTPDGISVTGFPLHMLLREALGVSDNQLVGEPHWVNSDRFDIEAKVAAEDAPKLQTLKPQQRLAMFLPIFEERFGLKFHHETKELTQYVLVVAKDGPKLKEAKEGDTYPNGVKGPDGVAHAGLMRMGRGEFTGQGVELAVLVRQLSFQFGSTVVDKTGLTGKYDFDLKWTPDEASGAMFKSPDSAQPGSESPAPPATSGPSIFTALQEQLGLRLEAHKEPADVIVIDHIDQPSPN
jgi:bla regulator protein blaR1